MKDQLLAPIQKALQKNSIDCWLIYVKKEMKSWILPKLNLEKAHISRPLFFLFYKDKNPIALFSELDSPALSSLQDPIIAKTYFTYLDQRSLLKELLKGVQSLAIDFVSDGSLPSLSTIDAGFKEWLDGLKVKLISSSLFFDEAVAKVTKEGLLSHRKAAAALSEIAEGAFQWIETHIKNKEIYEGEVAREITSQMEKRGLIPLAPIVAFGENSANPHYEPQGKGKKLEKGEVVLIDLWSKLKDDHSIYADFTFIGYLPNRDDLPPEDVIPTKVKEVFEVVRGAQKKVIDELQRLLPTSKLLGEDADRYARSYIEERGYGEYFRHRTGHNVGEECHGLGVNFDSIEFPDTRRILSEAIFTIEPGIYLPGEFGIRLECDIYIDSQFKVEVTGGLQNEIRILRQK